MGSCVLTSLCLHTSTVYNNYSSCVQRKKENGLNKDIVYKGEGRSSLRRKGCFASDNDVRICKNLGLLKMETAGGLFISISAK